MSENHTRELMVKYFPKCPICKSDANYTISPSKYIVQCNSCKAKLLSQEFLDVKKDLTSLQLFALPSSLVQESLMQILKSVINKNKEYPVSFWKDIEASFEKYEAEAEVKATSQLSSDFAILTFKYADNLRSDCPQHTLDGCVAYRLDSVLIKQNCQICSLLQEVVKELRILNRLVCPSCGTVLARNEKFCPKCGKETNFAHL